jgi:uridine phosphorylase
MTSGPHVLRPHAPVAERVLLPGDPGRALRLAQHLLEGPKMLNHHRGLWGYTGEAQDGRPLTIQSTGLGGPSAAAVVAELVALGARRLIRTGTADAPAGGAPKGALVIAEAVLPRDGTSRALGGAATPGGAGTPGGAEALKADATLVAALVAAAGPNARAGLVASTDLLPEHDPATAEECVRAGAEAVDLTTAAVLAAAARHGAAAACVLAISGVLGFAGERLDPDAVEEAERTLGEVAAAALSRAPAAAV